MNVFIALFGSVNHVGFFQECARAVLIFAYGLLLLRFSGRRTFGHWSALDVVMSVIVGSALGKAMTGSASLPGTMAATAVMAGLHVLVGHAATHNRRLAHLVSGRAVILVDHGRIDHSACQRNMVSQSELESALRERGVDAERGLDNVKRTVLEPSGKISVIKHDPCRPAPS